MSKIHIDEIAYEYVRYALKKSKASKAILYTEMFDMCCAVSRLDAEKMRYYRDKLEVKDELVR